MWETLELPRLTREPSQSPERLWEIRKNQDRFFIEEDPGQFDIRPGYGKQYCRWCNGYHFEGVTCGQAT
jgi:hypothetical protein